MINWVQNSNYSDKLKVETGLEVIFWAKIYSFGSMCTGVHQFYGGEVPRLEKKIDGTNFELSSRLAQPSWPAHSVRRQQGQCTS